MADDRCDLLCLDLEKAEALRARALPVEVSERAAREAKALADPTRLTLAVALAAAGELCVCDLAWISEPRAKLVSHHVRALRTPASRARAGRQDGHVLADPARRRCCRTSALAEVSRTPALADAADAPPAAVRERTGGELSGAEQSGAFRVEGMDCAACAKTVEKVVAALDGVAPRRSRSAPGRWSWPGTAPDEAITRPSAAPATAPARPRAARPRGAGAVLAARRPRRVSTTVLGRAAGRRGDRVAGVGAPRVRRRAAVPALDGVGGWPIARARWPRCARRSLDMNVLMALAAIGAVGIGAYAEGAWVLVLFAVGTDAGGAGARPQPPLGRRR